MASGAKPIVFSSHAQEQMAERGASAAEVAETIRTGQPAPAKRGRQSYRKNFQYNRPWGKRTYAIKQVMPIVVEEADRLVVVTVYTFYF